MAALPTVTSSRVGNIPIEEIDAAFSASVAAVQELQSLGAQLAVPLLQYGLSVYHLDTDLLAQLRPEVILTCLQTAHSAVLEGELRDAALQAVLGYVPTVVHCEAQDLAGVWADMRRVADAMGASQAGAELVETQQRQMEAAAESSSGRGHPRVACIQWPHPLMAAGAWTPQLVHMSGGVDVCGRVNEAVMLTQESLAEAAPDVIVFALCGLSLETAARAAAAAVRRLGDAWQSLPAARSGRVAVVDGEHVLSRPGPLLGPSLECLVEILHPEAQRFGHERHLWQWLPAAP